MTHSGVLQKPLFNYLSCSTNCDGLSRINVADHLLETTGGFAALIRRDQIGALCRIRYSTALDCAQPLLRVVD